jgi:hypothetical protein
MQGYADMRGVRHFWRKVPEIDEGGWNGMMAAFLNAVPPGSPHARRASGSGAFWVGAMSHPAIGNQE